MRNPIPSRRGTVILIVLWTISIGALIVGATQLLSYRQATVGRVAVQRVQARWAARAGIESTIQVMANHTESPVPDDAFAMTRDMEAPGVAYGSFDMAQWDIRHVYEGEEWSGPMDEQSKLNVNTASPGLLMLLDDMSFDVADAIIDWIDEDKDPSTLGVEEDYYLALDRPYKPRNEPMRTLAEIELVAGVWPEYLRGEDLNLNGRLDANENDGTNSLPLDEPDDVLDNGWSAYLTTYSVAGGATASGLPRIFLRAAEPEQLVERLGISDAQARSLIYYGRNDRNIIEKLSAIDLSRVDPTGNAGQTVLNPLAENLSDDQIRAVADEVSIEDPAYRKPGKINLNTIPPTLFRQLMTGMSADSFIADEILYRRDSQPEGIASLLELRDLPEMDQRLWDSLSTVFTTRSNVFMISSKGTSTSSGLDAEIIAIVDRSSLPIRIIEYREP